MGCHWAAGRLVVLDHRLRPFADCVPSQGFVGTEGSRHSDTVRHRKVRRTSTENAPGRAETRGGDKPAVQADSGQAVLPCECPGTLPVSAAACLSFGRRRKSGCVAIPVSEDVCVQNSQQRSGRFPEVSSASSTRFQERIRTGRRSPQCVKELVSVISSRGAGGFARANRTLWTEADCLCQEATRRAKTHRRME